MSAVVLEDSPGSLRLPLDQIALRPEFKVRAAYDVDTLAESIRREGQLAPLLVRPAGSRWELLAGYRRYHALRKIGRKNASVTVLRVDDREAALVALAENRERKDLNPIEEARALKAAKDLGVSGKELAAASGKSEAWVSNRLRLLSLPNPVQSALKEGTISAAHAEHALLRLERPQDQVQVAKEIVRNGLSVPAAESAAKELLEDREQRKAFHKKVEEAKHPKCPKCGQKAVDFDYDSRTHFRDAKYHVWNFATGRITGGVYGDEEKKPSPPSGEPTELRCPMTVEEWAAALCKHALANLEVLERVEVRGGWGDGWSLHVDIAEGDRPFKIPGYVNLHPEDEFETGEKTLIRPGNMDGKRRVEFRLSVEQFMKKAGFGARIPQLGLLGVDDMGVKCQKCETRQRLPKRAVGKCSKCRARLEALPQTRKPAKKGAKP